MQTIVTWATQDQIVPGGATYTQYRVDIRPAGGGDAVATELAPFLQSTVTVNDLPPGSYLAAVVLTDAAGTATGQGAVSSPFEVVAPDPTLGVPVSVTVAVGT